MFILILYFVYDVDNNNRKPTETEHDFYKKHDPIVGSNHAPKTQQARALTPELAGNSVEVV